MTEKGKAGRRTKDKIRVNRPRSSRFWSRNISCPQAGLGGEGAFVKLHSGRFRVQQLPEPKQERENRCR
jgi:hypothetical protein